MSIEMATYCVDVGSIAAGNFGWARVDDSCRGQSGEGIGAAENLLDRLQTDLRTESRSISIGFEAPLFLPIRSDPVSLTTRRATWERYAFSGGPRAGVLVTGMMQAAWLLGQLDRAVTTDPGRASPDTVHVWEAFVSGKATNDTITPVCPGGEHGPHACDALVAAAEAHRWRHGKPLRFGAVRRAGAMSYAESDRGLDLISAVTGSNGLIDAPDAWNAVIIQMPKPDHQAELGPSD